MAEPYKMPAPGKIAGAFDVAKGNFQTSRAFVRSSDITACSNISGIVGAAGYQDSGGQFYDNGGGNTSPYNAYGYSYNLRVIAGYPAQYTDSDFMLSYGTTPVTFNATQALYQIGVGGDGKLYLGNQIMGDVFSALYTGASRGSTITGVRTADPVPRSIANYGVFTYQKVQTVQLYDGNGNPYGAYSADWSCYFPLHRVWQGRNSTGGKITDYGSANQLTIALANAMNIPIYALITSAVDYSGHVLDSTLNIADTFSLFRTPSELKKAANGAQIPCAINDTNAIRNTPDPKDLPDYTPPGQPDNPTGGGDGDGDNDSDPLEIPDDPELTPINTGVGLWAFDANECDLVAKFLWAPKSFLGGIAGTDADVTRTWVNAFYLPFDIVSHDPSHVALARVYTGSYDTELDANSILPGYTTSFDLGTIDVIEYYGSFLDYPPYTSIYIYLPYIGYKQLDVSKIMRKRINVTYHVDLAIGTCTAIISYIAENSRVPFAMFTGQMGIPIQVSGLNTGAAMTASILAAFQTAAIVGAVIPGASAGMSALGGAAKAKRISATAESIGKGAIIGNLGVEGAQAAISGLAPHKPDAVSIGTAGGQSWLTCPQGAFLIISRAITATPNNFAELNGWATRYTGKVSEFTGFLSCSQVENTIAATDTEIAAINSALQNGIYI